MPLFVYYLSVPYSELHFAQNRHPRKVARTKVVVTINPTKGSRIFASGLSEFNSTIPKEGGVPLEESHI